MKMSAGQLERAWGHHRGSFPSFMARLDRERVPYLSHSKVAEFRRCPRCYHRQYVLGQREETEAMHLGTLFHAAARRLYTARSTADPQHLLSRLQTRGLDADSDRKLRNAIILLHQNRWSAHSILSVEEPFFIDLASGLPPVIGVADLILRHGSKALVVDHKTSARFNDLSADQLVLYAEHARRAHRVRRVEGWYDEYRLVANLATIRKPAFRRTRVAVDRTLLPPLIQRYREVWQEIATLAKGSEPAAAYDCWRCNSAWWYR